MIHQHGPSLILFKAEHEIFGYFALITTVE